MLASVNPILRNCNDPTQKLVKKGAVLDQRELGQREAAPSVLGSQHESSPGLRYLGCDSALPLLLYPMA